MSPSRPRGIALAIVTAAVWGTVPIAGKVALGGITSPALSALRLALATAFMAVLLVRRGSAPPRRPPGLAVLAGVFLGINYVAYMWGLERAGAATAQVVIQTAPLFLVVLGVFVLGERLRKRQILGTAAALAGVFLVSWKETSTRPGSEVGVAFIVVAALAWGVYAAAHKRLGRDHASGASMTWIFAVAALLNLPLAATGTARSADAAQIAAIAYLCVNTVVAYWCFAEALRHIDASLAAVICTLGPVVTFGILAITNRMDQTRIPHEPLGWLTFAGAALVICGVSATVSARPRADRPA